MTAYAIFIRNKTLDAVELKTYSSKSGSVGSDYPIKVLASNGEIEVLEGDAAEGVVMLQFEDMAHAKALYESTAYQQAMQHRLKGADYRVILVEGLAG